MARELDRGEEAAVGARRVDVDPRCADLDGVHRRVAVDDPLLPFAGAADERAPDPEELVAVADGIELLQRDVGNAGMDEEVIVVSCQSFSSSRNVTCDRGMTHSP